MQLRSTKLSIIRNRPRIPWNPKDAAPILLLDPRIGVLATGGARAGYRDPVATWENLGIGASDATQSTSNNQPIYLPHNGDNYLHLPGIAGNYAEIPASSALNFSNGFDIWVSFPVPYGQIPSTSSRPFCGKNATYLFRQTSGRSVGIYWTDTNNTQHTATSLAIPDEARAIRSRVILTNEDGVSEARFYYSLKSNPTDSDWTLSRAVTFVEAYTLRTNNAAFRVGSYTGNSELFLTGAISRCSLKNGLGDQVVFIDFTKASHGASSFVCDTGQTVTIATSGENPARIIGHSLLRFDGDTTSSDNLLSTLDNPLTAARAFFVATCYSTEAVSRRALVGRNADGSSNAAGSIAFSYKRPNGNLAVLYNGLTSPLLDHGTTALTRYIHESLANGTSNLSRKNGSEVTSSTESIIDVRSIRISDNGSAAMAMDVELAAIFPASMSSDDVTRMRQYLVERFDLTT